MTDKIFVTSEYFIRNHHKIFWIPVVTLMKIQTYPSKLSKNGCSTAWQTHLKNLAASAPSIIL